MNKVIDHLRDEYQERRRMRGPFYFSLTFVALLLLGLVMLTGWLIGVISGGAIQGFFLDILDLVTTNVEALLGLIAVLVVLDELSFKNRTYWHEVDLKKAELDAQKEAHAAQKKALEEQNMILKHRIDQVNDTGRELSFYIARELVEHSEWAQQALEKVQLGSATRSLFGYRKEHFPEEKKTLARLFMPELLDRCKAKVEEGKTVYLVIDSGTTLYPFFREIGTASVNEKQYGRDWVDKVKVLTNNLPGVDTLMECGIINPNDKYSDLAVNCYLLPGRPLPAFSAILGNETEAALRGFRETRSSGQYHFIGLATGNWVRVRRSHPPCPIPMARGKGHKEFK